MHIPHRHQGDMDHPGQHDTFILGTNIPITHAPMVLFDCGEIKLYLGNHATHYVAGIDYPKRFLTATVTSPKKQLVLRIPAAQSLGTWTDH